VQCVRWPQGQGDTGPTRDEDAILDILEQRYHLIEAVDSIRELKSTEAETLPSIERS
jgi:hypothetical protein